MSIASGEIVIQRGFEPGQTGRVAGIFIDAFHEKMGGMIGDRPTARELLRESLEPGMILTARRDGDILGIACLKTRDAGFFKLKPRQLLRRFGLLDGLLRYGLSRIFNTTPTAGTLSLDAIAVDAGCRGLGIGGLLLEAVEAFALEHGCQNVSLEVVDTNPRARMLYQRVGYTVKKTTRLPFLRRLKGFGAFDTMIKPLPAAR